MHERRYYGDELRAARARRFAAQLADTLHELGITHKRLATELEVSLHTVDSWTRAVDPNVPGRENLDRLCDLLEHREQGAGVALAKAAGHKWEPSTPPTVEPVHLHAVAEPKPVPTNLPLELSSFIGREQQMAQVAGLLKQSRLMTLTGPGGTGKTRLGLQVAAEMLDDFPDGVWFVGLAALTNPKLVMSAIASTLGVKEAAGQSLIDSVRGYLQNKQLLMIADNFEQVLTASAQLVELLSGCPELKVLVTSRAPLRVRGEHEHPVPPLSVPDTQHLPTLEQLTQYEAVRLFIERATEIKPDFAVGTDNAQAVAEICTRLDGLPLAIELAAARVRVFPPQALLTRLSSSLKLLTGGATDLPARQQTLHNTIEWSYDLLEEGEKQLFRRMAVFQGGRTLEALEAVCDVGVRGEGRGVNNHNEEPTPRPSPLTPLEIDVLEGVGSLVSKSLLQQREGSDGEPRFWMLETIHEYAREKLAEEGGEEGTLRREHALYFMELVEEADAQLRGAQEAEWLARLEDEHDNLREALRWARESARGAGGGQGTRDGGQGEIQNQAADEAVEIGLRTAGALWRFWYARGYLSEGLEQLNAILDFRFRILESSPFIRDRSKVPPQAGPVNLKSKIAKALNGAGNLAYVQSDYLSARTLHEESLAIRRELGDKKGISGSLDNLSIVAFLQGNYTTARTLGEESLALDRELGTDIGLAQTLHNLGMVAYAQGDYAWARSLYEESIAISRQLGSKVSLATSLRNLGRVAYAQGDYATARSLYEESLSGFRELGNKGAIATALNYQGNMALMQGDYATARSLYQESLAMRRELAGKGDIAESLDNLGHLARREGNIAGARRLYMESLGISREIGARQLIAVSLAGLGAVACSAKQPVKGVILLGAAEALTQAMGAAQDPVDLAEYEQGVAAARAQLDEAAFERSWAEGRAMTMEQAITYALDQAPQDG